ncbi:hypothetical protein [Cryptosporangium japonicum]|uniref:Uncharacterized protein n=1 Tax=Cryptosporangium japonicum TaxID=80872 RepID=A0ABP3EFC2_9ACTN
MPSPDLKKLAGGFADLLTDVLNRTIAKHPVKITAKASPVPGVVFVGNRLSDRSLLSRNYFPLRHRPGVPPLHMLISGRLSLDHEGRYLMVQSSVCAVARDAGGGR